MLITYDDTIECSCEGKERDCQYCNGDGEFHAIYRTWEYGGIIHILLYEGLFEVSSIDKFKKLLDLSSNNIGNILFFRTKDLFRYELVLYPLQQISSQCPECLGQGYYEDDDWKGNVVKEPCGKCLGTGTHWHLVDEEVETESLPF